jgi:hypothetical protein
MFMLCVFFSILANQWPTLGKDGLMIHASPVFAIHAGRLGICTHIHKKREWEYKHQAGSWESHVLGCLNAEPLLICLVALICMPYLVKNRWEDGCKSALKTSSLWYALSSSSGGRIRCKTSSFLWLFSCRHSFLIVFHLPDRKPT